MRTIPLLRVKAPAFRAAPLLSCVLLNTRQKTRQIAIHLRNNTLSRIFSTVSFRLVAYTVGDRSQGGAVSLRAYHLGIKQATIA